ncbi:class Ib ribonucleoside-diphosphate reductase assembly flavoprotein NrdI [Streptococcus ovuberis]|uniref:Putative NrdI-like protein n=1 Tax=Streptococcus ovuberis TaxID=1936207 RepID=A0A7X6MYQ4_9STRE|nr:class Ib ribonucleoside-diphosphate reductase assembly flavoprotein NrdI [Streptococcus ovuberis]NKZ20213.1 class Ib ribonucleoside-diphosphate reductase assembly flavoprotein NrdI [Streptococcus ovuberis]
MTTFRFVYISLSGNTASFVKRLSQYLLEKHPELEIEAIDIKDLVKEGRPFFAISGAFVAFLPTYLEGGNGIDNGDQEILTNPLGDFIAFEDNASKCLGIVGSGNRNFNNQYCLTAKQYSQRFGFPVLDDFEMRGMLGDIKRIAEKIENLYGF